MIATSMRRLEAFLAAVETGRFRRTAGGAPLVAQLIGTVEMTLQQTDRYG